MKKRLSILLLSLLLFCSLAACNKKDKYGVTYTEDGVLQNTLIQCVITETGPKRVHYEVHNASEYKIYLDSQFTVLQIYKDGGWVEAPHGEHRIIVDRDNLGAPRRVNKPLYEGGVDFNYYKGMTPGLYRILVKLEVQKPEKDAAVEEIYATAYFTVTDAVYGVFETKDGILQNTSITLAMKKEALTAPVLGVGAYLQNESCFEIKEQKYAANDNYSYLLEVLVDGVWTQAPSFGEIIREDDVRMDFWKPEQIESGAAELMDKRYIALTPGEYRMRVKYAITEAVDGAEIPEGQLEAVAYFTVTAPVE